MSRIADLEVMTLAVPGTESTQVDGSLTTAVVKLTDEDGRVGIGECDGPPPVIKAFIDMKSSHAFWSRGLRELLIGQDPLEIAALWQRLYDSTTASGRRGLGLQAISGVDIALHDLAGKQIGQPTYKLMGGARRERIYPYATIFPGWPEGYTIAKLMERMGQLFERALAMGFQAVKMCVIFGSIVTDRQLAELINEGRRMLGDRVRLMIDFGYRWRDWADAKWVLDRVADSDLWFAEATLQHDDLLGHAELATRCPMRICGAEYATTRWECREWIQTGKVHVLQPDINHVGGLTEIRRIADLCELYGVQLIPHGWKTGITSAAGMHFQASCPNAPMFEYVAPQLYDLPLRTHLVTPEPELVDGMMALPTAPGLGIELNPDAVKRYRVS
jgi:L-rhamnonate dehydratase